MKSSINLKRNEMARIKTYEQDAAVTLGDKVIGTNTDGTTYNYTLTSVSNIFKQSNAAGIGGQFTWKFDQGDGNSAGSGEMDGTFSGGDFDFADLTAIKVSKYTYENNTDLSNALSLLSGKAILLVDVLNHNNYGVYNTGTISQNSSNNDLYDLSLTYVSGNGAMVDEKIYAVTVNYPDGDTTYSISCVDGDATSQEKIRLTNSSSATDDIVLEAGAGLSIARSSDTITHSISSIPNSVLLTALSNLESSSGAADENITIGTDSGDTIIITGNLQVSGTTTTVNSTTVSLNDHNIVLDSGNSTSAVVDGAGWTLEGGSGDDVTWMWLASGTKMELKKGSSYANAKMGDIESTGDVTVGDDIFMSSATPTVYFTDSDTGADTMISSDSSAGSFVISADYNNESNTTKIYFKCDGDEVGHLRGNNAYVGSLRLFPEKNANTAQGIFFGTETAGAYDGSSDWSNIRVMSMDASSVLHLYPGTGTTGALKIASSETGTVTAAGDVDVTGSVKCTQNLRRTVTAVTLSTNTATCTLTANDNFSFTLNNAANTINIVAAAENVGQSGTIVATNPSSVGSFSVAQIQGNGDAAEVLTPDGATISWPTNANGVNLISYYVAATDKILINFIGNFTNP